MAHKDGKDANESGESEHSGTISFLYLKDRFLLVSFVGRRYPCFETAILSTRAAFYAAPHVCFKT